METLSPTWDKALAEAYQIKQDIFSEVEQNKKGEESITAGELQRHKDEAAKWKKGFEDAASSTSTKTSAPENTKEEYWEKEARKYKELYREVNKKYKYELPSTECVNLIREATLENWKLKEDNKKLTEEISQFKEYKAKLNKSSQEQKKYVKDLELSIYNKQQKLIERRKSNDFPTMQDFATEAQISCEADLLEHANVLQDGGLKAFKPTLKITYENFKLKGQVKAIEQQLHQARTDADLIRGYDDDTIVAGKEKLTRGELVIMKRKLNDKVQRLIRTPQQGHNFELYKTAAYVLTSKYAKYNSLLPEFFEKAHDLLCKVWEEPLPHDHPYARKLYANGPKN